MERVRWGIIGVGDVTEAKSGPGFQQAERSELIAVMRRNGDLAADYARRHGVPRWYDDADELINDPDLLKTYQDRGQTVLVSEGGRYAPVVKMIAVE